MTGNFVNLTDLVATDIATDNEYRAAPRAMENAFREWWSRNAYALEDGGCGDVEALYLALSNAASQKA
jgi:hypothetical protein